MYSLNKKLNIIQIHAIVVIQTKYLLNYKKCMVISMRTYTLLLSDKQP